MTSPTVRSIAMSLSVCLSASMSQKPQVQTSRNFLYMLPLAVARSCSDDNVMYTSGFVDDVMLAHNGPYGVWLIGQYSRWLTRDQNRGRSVMSTTVLLYSWMLKHFLRRSKISFGAQFSSGCVTSQQRPWLPRIGNGVVDSWDIKTLK